MQSIEWRPVVGYEGMYEVSDVGDVRNSRTGRVLKVMHFAGYSQVGLSRNGTKRIVRCHRAIALAFLGKPPTPLHEVCHGDADRGNNAVGNLRWGTRSDNMQDKLRHGHNCQAEKTECPHGHPYDIANTYMRKDRVGRLCRTCSAANSSASLARKSAARKQA